MTTKDFRAKLNEKTEAIVSALKDYYVKDERPFACGYSGGKDSSVMVDLVVKMLLEVKRPTKTVFVQFSDTLMEMENTISAIHESLDRLEEFAKKHNLPIVIKKVKPITSETFMSLIIGKGYQLPSELRWCTDRLKLRPQARLMDEYNAEFPNGMFAVVGSRKEESRERAERLENKTIEGMCKTHDIPKWSMLAPIEDLTTDEIWTYLSGESSSWIDEATLAKVYEDASDDGDECRTTLEGESGNNAGCGKSARYGCWICPKVYSKDKALINLGKKFSYMKKQEAFRNWLIEEGSGWKNRRNYRNDNQGRKIYNVDNHRKGMTMPSGYTLEFRKEILTRLWALNNEIKQYKKDDLISYDELVFIQNEWLKEGDLELSVQSITGVALDGIDTRLKEVSDAIVNVLAIKPTEGSLVWIQPSLSEFPFVKREISPRFITVLVSELIKNDKTDKEIFEFIRDLSISEYYSEARLKAHKELMSMRIYTHKYFLTDLENTIVKREWDTDGISFGTFVENKIYEDIINPDDLEFSLDGDYVKNYKKCQAKYKPFEKLMIQYKEMQEKEDITMCETISLEDKMAFFE